MLVRGTEPAILLAIASDASTRLLKTAPGSAAAVNANHGVSPHGRTCNCAAAVDRGLLKACGEIEIFFVAITGEVLAGGAQEEREGAHEDTRRNAGEGARET